MWLWLESGSEATNLSALLGNRRKISAVFWKSRVLLVYELVMAVKGGEKY